MSKSRHTDDRAATKVLRKSFCIKRSTHKHLKVSDNENSEDIQRDKIEDTLSDNYPPGANLDSLEASLCMQGQM